MSNYAFRNCTIFNILFWNTISFPDSIPGKMFENQGKREMNMKCLIHKWSHCFTNIISYKMSRIIKIL